MVLLNNIIPRAPSKEEYFSVDAKDVEMQNMNASGPRRPEGGLKAGQQQQQQGIRIKKQFKDILNIMLAYIVMINKSCNNLKNFILVWNMRLNYRFQ